MQYSWETEDSNVSTIAIDIDTKEDFNFTYKGGSDNDSFESSVAVCEANSTSSSKHIGTVSGHKSVVIENMLDGPKPLMKSMVSNKWYLSPEQYPSLYWISLSGAEKIRPSDNSWFYKGK